jgi:hypothetical protein
MVTTLELSLCAEFVKLVIDDDDGGRCFLRPRSATADRQQ